MKSSEKNKMLKQMQIGKNGINDNFIQSLKHQFNNSNNVKISVLSSFTRDKKEIEKTTQEILDKLGKNYTARIIGFTIAIRKWRKDMRE